MAIKENKFTGLKWYLKVFFFFVFNSMQNKSYPEPITMIKCISSKTNTNYKSWMNSAI
jgi:hypothetical protein